MPVAGKLRISRSFGRESVCQIMAYSRQSSASPPPIISLCSARSSSSAGLKIPAAGRAAGSRSSVQPSTIRRRMLRRRIRSKSPAETRSSATGIRPMSYSASTACSVSRKAARSMGMSPSTAAICLSASRQRDQSWVYSARSSSFPCFSRRSTRFSRRLAAHVSFRKAESAPACSAAVAAAEVRSLRFKSGPAMYCRERLMRRRRFTASSVQGFP